MSGWSSSEAFVRSLSAVKMPSVFNPYNDVCAAHDLEEAPDIRRRNLELVLSAALTGGADELWIAQELGRKGGRRTGLALTDEPNLEIAAERWGLTGIRRATHGPAVRESTASYVWRALSVRNARVFFWNVFPFHSHPSGKPLLNRGHTRAEAALALPHLLWLLNALQPSKVVAIGRAAESTLRKQGVDCLAVRHPGRGGGELFLKQMRSVQI